MAGLFGLGFEVTTQCLNRADDEEKNLVEAYRALGKRERQFQAQQRNQKWVTDVTEFNVRGDKLYRAQASPA